MLFSFAEFFLNITFFSHCFPKWNILEKHYETNVTTFFSHYEVCIRLHRGSNVYLKG